MEWWQILLICVAAAFALALLSIVLYRQFFKRFYDFLLSLVGLIVLSPLMIILIVVTAIAMSGNPFFTQLRPGKKDKNGNERIFRLIKFRSMSNRTDADGNLLPDEQRLNKFGKLLRSTSLDELPELINILKGDMSVVGPRPLLVRDMVFMTDEQRTRHNVRQGLTGLAQVNGRNNISWEQKFSFDLEYVRDITLLKDLKILFKTVFKVLKRSDINREGMASDMDLSDYLLQKGDISREEYDEKQLSAKRLIDKTEGTTSI